MPGDEFPETVHIRGMGGDGDRNLQRPTSRNMEYIITVSIYCYYSTISPKKKFVSRFYEIETR
jgi:hypothetical protein